jgi:hypothetical protein
VQTLRGSAAPFGTGVQRPIDDSSAQLRHAPPHATSQQTPSTQKLLRHSPAPAHGWPLGLRPQLPLASQTLPSTQSPSPVQRARHAPSRQRNGEHTCTPGVRQVPMPLHVPAVFRRSPPLQVGATQTVSAAYSAQPPMPSHVPVCPHDAAPLSLQIACGSALPASTGQHAPERPTRLQLTHGPLQATLQQTPSAQKPDAQSVFFWHTAPGGLGPQLPFTQLTPSAQSVLDLHVTTQALVAASQLNGAQIVAGPDLQRPCPSHTLTPTTAPSEQEPALQIVPAT